jgi:probable phosphoglycerate mutase
MRRAKLDAVYSSPARASVETAVLMAAAKDLPVVRVPQLKDLTVNPSALNGLIHDEKGLREQVCLRFINNPRWDALAGVEPTGRFRHRVIQAIEGIAARHTGQSVAIVTHQPVINAYLSMILGIERDMFFQPEFTSMTTVRILHDLYAVQVINDQSHLKPTFIPR